jgi:hypothetical protein
MSDPCCDRMVVKAGNHWPCICTQTPDHEGPHRCDCGHGWEDDSEPDR